MQQNIIFISCIYSKVDKPADSGRYEYNLEFYCEGFKQPQFGCIVSVFFTMKDMASEKTQDLLSCQCVFHFLSDQLTDEDILWMLNRTYSALKSYPLAKEENITEVLNAFPSVSPETARLNNNFKDWFYANR